ncbi:MAG TPA: DUF975 family protein [Clostridiales bacterium]|jgi:uncharacterized membrane protein|nr:DUF975 family protein [Clostridiales bacterium]
MFINRIAIKEDAKVKIAAARPSPYGPTVVYIALIFVITAIQSRLDERFTSYIEGIMRFFAFRSPWPAFDYSSVMLLSALFIILLRIVLSVFQTGYRWYSLKISRSMKATFSNILEPTNYLLKVVGLYIAISIITFLLSLLFIIPGIIASYRYRQAYYILHDHPEYGILQCMRESARLSRGYKVDLFILDLSFLGWYILCSLTFGILLIWKMPYFEVTYANYYNAIKFNKGFDQAAGYGGDPWDTNG